MNLYNPIFFYKIYNLSSKDKHLIDFDLTNTIKIHMRLRKFSIPIYFLINYDLVSNFWMLYCCYIINIYFM